MWERFAESARQAILIAQNYSLETGKIVTPAHLLLGLVEVESEHLDQLLVFAGVSREELKFYAQSLLEPTKTDEASEPKLSAQAKRALELAAHEATLLKHSLVGPEHLFLALVRLNDQEIAPTLRAMGFEFQAAQRQLALHDLPFPVGNPLNDLTENGRTILENAQTAMRTTFCGRINTLHLLLGLLADSESEFAENLRASGVDLEQLQSAAKAAIVSDGEIATPNKRFSDGAKAAFERARIVSRERGEKWIGAESLLLALLDGKKNDDGAARVLGQFGPERMIAVLQIGLVESKSRVSIKNTAPKISWLWFLSPMFFVAFGLLADVFGRTTQVPDLSWSQMILIGQTPVWFLTFLAVIFKRPISIRIRLIHYSLGLLITGTFWACIQPLHPIFWKYF